MAQINAPRGMRDFLPADKARRERVLTVIRDTYRRHGFDEIETPVVEDYERLHAGIGGDNEKLSFSILKRGLTADDFSAAHGDSADLCDLGLRYDLTVPLARFYASNRAKLPNVFRALQIAPVWRAERPQKGRYRQFVQCDIDIIGDDSIFAEAELISAGVDALAHLELEGAVVRINDRRILDAMLNSFGFDPAERPQVLITIDKLDKIGTDGVVAELAERSSNPDAVAKTAAYLNSLPDSEQSEFNRAEIQARLPEGVPETLIDGLLQIADAVKATNPENMPTLRFDPFLVRGMGYYTGPIFEIGHPSVSYSFGGGGRYDGMIGRFLTESVPAVGFSLGFERLVDLLAEGEDAASDSYLLVYDVDVPLAEVMTAKRALIDAGKRVRIAKRAKNMKPLLAQALSDGFTHTVSIRAGVPLDIAQARELS